MKKFLFSLTMIAAVTLAGFTTSCGGGDDNNADSGNVTPQQPDIENVYASTVNIEAVNPENIEDRDDLATVNSDVKVIIKPSANALDLSIKGIDLSAIGVPAVAQPFDVELTNIPYNLENGVYKVNFTQKVSLPFASVSAELQYLKGDVTGSNINIEIYAIGDNDLLNMPVLITVQGPKK